MTLTIPELSLVVLIGAVRLRQVDVRPQALQADRGPVVRLLPRRWSPTTRTTRRRPTTPSRCCTSSPRKRLARGRLTVVDATNVQPEARKPLVELAREYHVPAGRHRPRPAGAGLPGAQPRAARPRLRPARRPQPDAASCGARCAACRREGFRHVFVLQIAGGGRGGRRSSGSRCGTTGRHEHGPFDIIGDVHGCCDELEELLRQLGYAVGRRDGAVWRPSTPSRGPQGGLPRRPGGPRPAHPRHAAAGDGAWSQAGSALCVPGNHDMKLLRKLRGKDVQITHGLAETLARARARRDRRSSATRSPSSSTGWSATTCSTTASWSSPTPG